MARGRWPTLKPRTLTAFVTSLVFSCGPISVNGGDYLSETAHLLPAKGKILPRLPEGLGYHAASLLAREFFQVFGSNLIHVLCRNLPRGYMSDRGAMAKGTLARDGEGGHHALFHHMAILGPLSPEAVGLDRLLVPSDPRGATRYIDQCIDLKCLAQIQYNIVRMPFVEDSRRVGIC